MGERRHPHCTISFSRYSSQVPSYSSFLLLLPILHPRCTILVEGVVVATATTSIVTSDDIVEARATKPTANDGAMEGQEEDSEAEKNSEHSSDEEAEAKKEV